MNRSGTIALFALAGIALGALREFLFVNLNYQLDHVERATEFSYAHSIFQRWTMGWDLNDLTRLKWTLALLFIAVMLGLALLLARLLTGDHRYTPGIVLGYLSAGAVALLFHALARTTPAFEGTSVKVLHMLQYPVVLFFVWAAWTLRRLEEK